jgi:hypothetical protein
MTTEALVALGDPLWVCAVAEPLRASSSTLQPLRPEATGGAVEVIPSAGARSSTHPDRAIRAATTKARTAESARVFPRFLRRPHAHHRDLVAGATPHKPAPPNIRPVRSLKHRPADQNNSSLPTCFGHRPRRVGNVRDGQRPDAVHKNSPVSIGGDGQSAAPMPTVEEG